VAVGVVHRSQRAAADIALQRCGLGDVVVDTANRLQGREFDVVVAMHPLSGRTDASAFRLDAGRLCVLASRHRQCCVFVGRGGASQLLNDYPPPGRASHAQGPGARRVGSPRAVPPTSQGCGSGGPASSMTGGRRAGVRTIKASLPCADSLPGVVQHSPDQRIEGACRARPAGLRRPYRFPTMSDGGAR